MAGWTTPYLLLRDEFVQRADEGAEIPAALRARFNALDERADTWDLSKVDPIYDDLMALPGDPELARREPNDLASIRALRPEGPRRLPLTTDDGELRDRMHGAWTGRCVGCALGKPVEIMGFARDDQGRWAGRAQIRRYLENRGAWPLDDFFPGDDAGDGMTLICPASQREQIAYMEPDDDVHYTLVGLKVLEDHGPGFGWLDVARTWMHCLPIRTICTAEQQAILNLQRHDSHLNGRDPSVTPEWVRRHRNPYREWIGAQIRSDGWAFCCAGLPELAAEFAWRDAHWTHERNGIYGEMMFAAMQAAAFVEHDPRTLIEIGLSEVPGECRLAQWVRRAVGWCDRYADFEACMQRVESELGDMSPVHTINNALVCVVALLIGGIDSARAPVIAVMSGLDTDCNGASVGSIVGAAVGRSGFDDGLAARLNDEVRPAMIGFQRVSMTELADRCAAVRGGIAEG